MVLNIVMGIERHELTFVAVFQKPSQIYKICDDFESSP